MGDVFSWEYLTRVPRPDEVFAPLSTLVLLLLTIGLLVGYVLYSRPGLLWSRHLLRVRTSRRWGSILMWICSLGIFFFVVGWLQINPFSLGERIWVYLSALALLIAIVMIGVDVRRESRILSQERTEYREAVVRGVHMRRPPRLSRTRKR